MNVFPRAQLEALDPTVQDYLAATVKRLGYFGEFFAVVGQNPQALIQFMEYTKAVKAPLSDRQNELLALVVCNQLGADYERIQHERLAERLGFPREWISEAIGRPIASHPALTNDEQLLKKLALEILDSAEVGAASVTLQACRERLGDSAALAAVLQTARFMMIATLVRTFQLKLPVESIFAS